MSVRPRPTGFTLIELAFTLVIFALLAGFAVPSFSRVMNRARVEATLGRLSGDIYLARALAARDGRPVTLRFVPAEGCAEAYEIVDDRNRLLRRVATDPGAGPCLTWNVARAMRMSPRGMLVGSPRTIRAERGGAADSVTVSMVGRVYRWRGR